MAFKRTTKKTGSNSRRSMTLNTNGPTTFSNSTKAGPVTYTHTSKGGKYYTTQTTRFPNGFVERKRIYSSAPKKRGKKASGFSLLSAMFPKNNVKPKRKVKQQQVASNEKTKGFPIGIVLIAAVVIIVALFG